VRDRLFIVSGMYSAGELMDRCREALGHPPELESMEAPEPDTGGCEAMIGINDALPEKFRLRLLGSVNDPVEADLYVAPVIE
jgi:hypothetical protein